MGQGLFDSPRRDKSNEPYAKSVGPTVDLLEPEMYSENVAGTLFQKSQFFVTINKLGERVWNRGSHQSRPKKIGTKGKPCASPKWDKFEKWSQVPCVCARWIPLDDTAPLVRTPTAFGSKFIRNFPQMRVGFGFCVFVFIRDFNLWNPESLLVS